MEIPPVVKIQTSKLLAGLKDHSKEKIPIMKVFISWSGERSQALAQALRDWIPLVLHYVEPWLSEVDIAAGERWAEAIAKELDESNFGIICVTKENIDSPWVLFEAGALVKSMQGSRAIPLLLDLEFKDITGPLAQFQAKKVEKLGLSEVINSLNQAANHAVPEAKANKLLEALWPEFEKRMASIPKQTSPAKLSRPQNEILEELVASIRSLDSRFREISDEQPRSCRFINKRRKRLYPFLVPDIAHSIFKGTGDPKMLLLLASMVREGIPWLYELGKEAYKTSITGPVEIAERTIGQFYRASSIIHQLYKEGVISFEELDISPEDFEEFVVGLENFQMRRNEIKTKNRPIHKK